MSASERERPAAGPAVLTVHSEDGGAMICERCELAERPLARLRGLLGRGGLERGAGMLLRPSNSVHTCFMRHPIDVVLLDSELRVVALRERLRPWRLTGARRARAVLELAAGEIERRGLAVGERLALAEPR